MINNIHTDLVSWYKLNSQMQGLVAASELRHVLRQQYGLLPGDGHDGAVSVRLLMVHL